MLDFLAAVLRFGLSICVTGSTGSGKTTLMSWILSTIPNEKRVFTIENGCREFDLVKEDAEGNVLNNVVHTVTRFSDDPKQNYDQERLLEFALTCNPDIVCVGEMNRPRHSPHRRRPAPATQLSPPPMPIAAKQPITAW